MLNLWMVLNVLEWQECSVHRGEKVYMTDSSIPSSHIHQNTYFARGTRPYLMASLALFLAALATFTILYCTQPLLPVYSREFSVSPAISSLSLSMTTIFLAISMPVAGFLSDALGRKSVMIVSLVLSTLFALGLPYVPGLTWLLVLRALQGIALSGVPAVAMAYLSEEIAPKDLGFSMGLYISGNTIGGLLGRIVVSTVSDHFGWRISLSAIAGVSIISSAAFCLILPKSRNFIARKFSIKTILNAFVEHVRDIGLICLYAIGALLMGSFVTVYNYITYRLMEHPYDLRQSTVGWIFLIYLVGTFSSSWFGKLADRHGRRRVMWWAVSLMFVGVLLTLSHPLLLLLFGMAVFTFGFFGGHSIASSWVGRRALTAKAQASSLYLFSYYFGSSMGGSSGGLVWSEFQWSGIVVMISCLLCLALVMTYVLSKTPPRNPL